MNGDVSHEVVYISGPMTGLPEFNYPAFARAQSAWEARGALVRSPHTAFSGDQSRSYGDCIRADVAMLVECSAIAMLPGWMASRGAKMELLVAQMMGCRVYDALTFAPLPVPTLTVFLPAP